MIKATLLFLLRLPWVIFRFILIHTDRDYWRMLKTLEIPRADFPYWEFVAMRRDEERAGRHNRRDPLEWVRERARQEQEAVAQEEAKRYEELPPEAGPKPQHQRSHRSPPPPPRQKTQLERDEDLFGLTGKYTEEDLNRIYRRMSKEAGGASKELNMARDRIKKYRMWTRRK